MKPSEIRYAETNVYFTRQAPQGPRFHGAGSEAVSRLISKSVNRWVGLPRSAFRVGRVEEIMINTGMLGFWHAGIEEFRNLGPSEIRFALAFGP